jgi:hypothetical protein
MAVWPKYGRESIETEEEAEHLRIRVLMRNGEWLLPRDERPDGWERYGVDVPECRKVGAKPKSRGRVARSPRLSNRKSSEGERVA